MAAERGSDADLPDFQASWRRAWGGCGASGSGEPVRQQLLQRYSEPARHYHTLQHLGECLQLLQYHRQLAQHAAEVELALWFHDAIYDVRSSSNEADSARWAAEVLTAAGVAEVSVARVQALILSTRHVAVPQDSDEQLLVDIDLAILGADARRFEQYEVQIRHEYAWVPAWLFRRKRRAILQGFLQRAHIYSTPVLREQFEISARVNLQAALQGRR